MKKQKKKQKPPKKFKVSGVCPNCGKKGPHLVPAFGGEPAIYTCSTGISHADITFKEIVMLAEINRISCDSELWGVTCHDGRTVAHIAAMRKCLPDDFNQWNLIDNVGVTVKEAFDRYNIPDK